MLQNGRSSKDNLLITVSYNNNPGCRDFDDYNYHGQSLDTHDRDGGHNAVGGGVCLHDGILDHDVHDGHYARDDHYAHDDRYVHDHDDDHDDVHRLPSFLSPNTPSIL